MTGPLDPSWGGEQDPALVRTAMEVQSLGRRAIDATLAGEDPQDAILAVVNGYDTAAVYAWCMGMARVATKGLERPDTASGELALSSVGRMQQDGTVEVVPMDEAPPPVRLAARLLTALVNGDKEMCVALYTGFRAQDTDGQIGAAMAWLVHMAAVRVRQLKAELE